MNVLLSSQPSLFPHPHERSSPPRPMSPYNMASRKRKADDEIDEMSVSPTTSPAIASRTLARPAKKLRGGLDPSGRPLPLPRLLETLDSDQLRTVLQSICERHPTIATEVVHGAPKPTVGTVIKVLQDYLEKFRESIPYGQSSSDYSFYRVRQPLMALVEALAEFTPQFLPPTQEQTSVSLQYLDGATKVIHQMPDWESQQYRHFKDSAYDDISRAWALVVTEASKRGGGFTLHTDGWDQALIKHNQQASGRLEQAVKALASLGWTTRPGQGGSSSGPSDSNSILNQIINGAYTSPVRVGPW